MDRETFAGTIRAFKHRKPFPPFTVAMVDGDRVEADHPKALAIRDRIALFAAPGNVPVIFDHESVSQVIGNGSIRGRSRNWCGISARTFGSDLNRFILSGPLGKRV